MLEISGTKETAGAADPGLGLEISGTLEIVGAADPGLGADVRRSAACAASPAVR